MFMLKKLMAGPAFDQLIAEKIMGQRVVEWPGIGLLIELEPQPEQDWHGIEDRIELPVLPRYSTDVAAAWQVVEHLKLAGYQCFIASGRAGEQCVVGFSREYGPGISSVQTCEFKAEATSLALAICQAALALSETSVR